MRLSPCFNIPMARLLFGTRKITKAPTKMSMPRNAVKNEFISVSFNL
jgi:hypothetical protein